MPLISKRHESVKNRFDQGKLAQKTEAFLTHPAEPLASSYGPQGAFIAPTDCVTYAQSLTWLVTQLILQALSGSECAIIIQNQDVF